MIQKRLFILMVALLLVGGDAMAGLAMAGCPERSRAVQLACCCGPDCPDNDVESGLSSRCCEVRGSTSPGSDPAAEARATPVPVISLPLSVPVAWEVSTPRAPATPAIPVTTRGPDTPRYDLFCSYLK